MQGLSAISGLLGKVGGASVGKAPARQGYFRNMVVFDGDDAYDTVAEVLALIPAVGVKARIWEYTVPAQQVIRWGFGSQLAPANQGYVFFCVLDVGTDYGQGTVLLSHENHSRHNTVPIAEFNDAGTHEYDTTSMNTSRTNNKEHLYPLPEGGQRGKAAPMVGQDSRLVIDYTPLVLATTADDFAMLIPVTIYD